MDLILIITTTSILGLVLLEAIISYRSDRQVEEVDTDFTLPRVEPDWVNSLEIVVDQPTSRCVHSIDATHVESAFPRTLYKDNVYEMEYQLFLAETDRPRLTPLECQERGLPLFMRSMRGPAEMYGAGELPLIVTGQGTSEVRTYPEDIM